MGLLESIESAVGAGNLERLAAGQGDYSEGSADHGHVQNLVSHAPSGMLENVLGQVAGRMDPQAYANHVTPGVGGTNPLGNLGSGALATVASMFIGHLMEGGGYSAQSLMGRIPGLQTTDPQRMDAGQVARVASYTQQNHPDLFGKVAAALGQKEPGVLQHLLGGGGMASLGQMLAGGVRG